MSYNFIVPTNINYTYSILQNNVSALIKTFPFLEAYSIGHSVLGKYIYCVRFGHGQKELFYSASIHANEWITSIVLMKFLEDICCAYASRF